MAIFIANIAGLSAQTKEVIDELNKSGFWMPYAQCLEDDGQMEGYLRNLDDFSIQSLNNTLHYIEEDHQRALALLKARKEICGKKKGKKADAELAKHFKDLEQAKRAFNNAEQAERRYEIVSRTINAELSHRKPPVMPEGRLLRFYHSVSNGYAGFRASMELVRKDDGGGTLLVEEQNMMRHIEPGVEEKEPEPIEVDDSVFVRVRDIVEQGHLYEVGRRYQPDIMIFDASGWSMNFEFEGGNIDSGGYANGPDHADTLNDVLRYLNALYKERTEATEEKKKGDNE